MIHFELANTEKKLNFLSSIHTHNHFHHTKGLGTLAPNSITNPNSYGL